MSDDEKSRIVDDLLRKALAGDVPPAAKRRMEGVFRRFREAHERDGAAAGREGERTGSLWLRPNWRWGRRVLAFASLLLVVLGGTLHLAGPRNALADSLFRLNTLVSISRQVRLAGAMDAAVRAWGPDGLPLDCAVVWRAPGTARIEVRGAGRLLKVLTASPEGVAVEDPVSGDRIGLAGLEDVRDPMLEPVLWLATPGSIADRIDARWIPRGGGAPAGGEPNAFILSDPASPVTVRISVDPRTLRPVGIVLVRSSPSMGDRADAVVLSASFFWDDPESGRD